VEQALEELRRVWWEAARSFSLRIVTSLDQTFEAGPREVTFIGTTIQSVLDARPRSDVDWMVVDEAHYLEENEFGASVSRLCGDGTRLLGLSATPGRGREDELAWQMDLFRNALVTPPELGSDPVSALVKKGVYAEVEHDRLENRDLSDLERTAAVGSTRAVDAACSAGRLEAVLEYVTKLNATDRSIVFGYSMAHCEVLAATLHRSGVQVEVVGSRKPESHNQEAIDRFRDGRLTCLVNVKYVATGADFPAANVAILTIPVGSPIQFEQVVGRVTRGPAVGGTFRARVADFDNHFRLHSGLQSYARYSRNWKAT
jgi:superfamily II DNA or RNA helicase